MQNEIFKPDKKVDYSDDKINMEMLLEDNERSIRVMALDVHQKIATHCVETYACVYILEGEIEFTVDKKVYDLTRGEMLIIPKNAPHSLIAKTRSKMMLVRI